MHADPQRAEELRNIGPPFSCHAWATRVWPNLNTLVAVCSGTFSTAIPKVMIPPSLYRQYSDDCQTRSVIGSDIIIQTVAYGSTECIIGKPFNLDDPMTFVVDTEDVVEYLDIANDLTQENILEAVRIVV